MITKPGSQTNQSIVDGIAVLQALAVSSTPVGGKELAEQLGLETTRANRLLKTLASIGITQQTVGRKYQPGPGMHVLASQSLYASGLLRSAMPTLEKLSFFGRTVALGVLWNDSVSFLYHAKPGMSSTEAIGRIGLRTATNSGIGMVLLSQLDQESVKHIYHDKLIPGYPEGITSLLNTLNAIRQQGYARVEVTSETPQIENRPSHTVAVAIGNPINAAIAISGWISESDTLEIAKELQHAKQTIEETLKDSNK
ncbi:IclR family transcriptional regulator [Paraglaciecola arctica]|uniref:IclR family transcriptional regulator n=1 Tax=Paraglaciecola arctica TaxID=1128911 RepID=UPI001C069C91|nr:helix-turn-helix domain-containing protein [Paraglaciecola arctica]MBU3005273.1 helix-turn-helix domain-containing protein [Paraglaciecola arctica]